MTKKQVVKTVFIIIIAIIVSCFITPIPVLIVWLIYEKWYNSKDHIKYEKDKIYKDAKIVNVATKVCGSKHDNKFRTTITFADGFKYVSHDTQRETSRFLNVNIQKLTLTEAMQKSIIEKAINAHYSALGLRRPPKPQHVRCGKCNYEGWYLGNCPQCESSMKIYIHD